MSDQEAWQLSDSAAVAYERDFVPALFAQWPPVIVEMGIPFIPPIRRDWRKCRV